MSWALTCVILNRWPCMVSQRPALSCSLCEFSHLYLARDSSLWWPLYRPLAYMSTSIIHLDVADKDQEWDATSHHNLIKCLICENEKQSRSASERCFRKRCKCWFDESSYDDIQWDQFSHVKRVVLMRQCRVSEINTGRGRGQEEQRQNMLMLECWWCETWERFYENLEQRCSILKRLFSPVSRVPFISAPCSIIL